MITMKEGTESNQVIIIIQDLPDYADSNVEMQENNDANQQQHIDDAIDEEENGHEEQLKDNANDGNENEVNVDDAVQNTAQQVAWGR